MSLLYREVWEHKLRNELGQNTGWNEGQIVRVPSDFQGQRFTVWWRKKDSPTFLGRLLLRKSRYKKWVNTV